MIHHLSHNPLYDIRGSRAGLVLGYLIKFEGNSEGSI